MTGRDGGGAEPASSRRLTNGNPLTGNDASPPSLGPVGQLAPEWLRKLRGSFSMVRRVGSADVETPLILRCWSSGGGSELTLTDGGWLEARMPRPAPRQRTLFFSRTNPSGRMQTSVIQFSAPLAGVGCSGRERVGPGLAQKTDCATAAPAPQSLAPSSSLCGPAQFPQSGLPSPPPRPAPAAAGYPTTSALIRLRWEGGYAVTLRSELVDINYSQSPHNSNQRALHTAAARRPETNGNE